jgi:hypothetical protein
MNAHKPRALDRSGRPHRNPMSSYERKGANANATPPRLRQSTARMRDHSGRNPNPTLPHNVVPGEPQPSGTFTESRLSWRLYSLLSKLIISTEAALSAGRKHASSAAKRRDVLHLRYIEQT